MGGRIQEGKGSHSGGIQEQRSDHSTPRACKPGRRAKHQKIPELGSILARTIRHFLPDLPSKLAQFPDPRRPRNTYYPKETLLWSGILIFLLALRSRRQFRFESQSSEFVANLNRIANSDVETAPHDDTIAYYLEQVEPEHAAELPAHIVRRLVRMRVLDRWRLYGTFLVVLDGTGQRFYRTRHCPYCLTQKTTSGETLYFHHVLEAKLVTANGLVLPLATEFIENRDPAADKQDCELKAFPRLAEKLKTFFPQMPITLGGDALYACKSVFDICEHYRWKFLFTFKEGSFPALFPEYERLRDLTPKNRVRHRIGKRIQNLAWVNDLNYEGHTLSAFECREVGPRGKSFFAWITNIRVGCSSVIILANEGGRLRWKIENEAFNILKNHGYELEHAYSEHEWAGKNMYFLLQVAHAINQLILKGSLLRNCRRSLGSLRNYFRRLAESFRRAVVDAEAWDPNCARAIQIRLDTS